MTTTRSVPQRHLTPSAIGRKLMATAVTLAAATGVMALATFGTFDSSGDTVTRSVLAPTGTPR